MFLKQLFYCKYIVKKAFILKLMSANFLFKCNIKVSLTSPFNVIQCTFPYLSD